MYFGLLKIRICFCGIDKWDVFWGINKSGVFWVFDNLGVCIGLRVCMCMCVLEGISVNVYVLRRVNVRGLSEGVCVRGSDS